MLNKVPLEIKLFIATTSLPLEKLQTLKNDDTIYLEKNYNEPCFVTLDNKVIANGEIIIIDGKVGLQISEIINEPKLISHSNHLPIHNDIFVSIDVFLGKTFITYEKLSQLERGSVIDFENSIPPVVFLEINGTVLENIFAYIKIENNTFCLITKVNKDSVLKDCILPIKEEKKIKTIEEITKLLQNEDNNKIADNLINENLAVVFIVLIVLNNEKAQEVFNLITNSCFKDFKKLLKEYLSEDIKIDETYVEIVLNEFWNSLNKKETFKTFKK